MQYVKQDTQLNIHPIFDDIERFYTLTSVKKADKTLIKPVFDSSFGDLHYLFNTYTDGQYDFEFVNKSYDKIPLVSNSKNLVLCFSGGKDSIAAAKHYQKLGYNLYLYHVHGINTPIHDEYQCAQEVADYLKLPIRIENVKLVGGHDYVEHPMKNIVIANGALQYGIREGISTKIAFGNYYNSSVYYDNFEYCGGDDIETWRAYEQIIKRIIPGFHMYIGLKNLNTTLRSVCTDKELLDRSVSCLCRAGMRQYWHGWVKKKFGVDIPKHRCGRCYKCNIEYIYMADHDLTEYNEEYYKYCFSNLKKNIRREYNSWYSDEAAWNHYMFYDMSKSKYF